ncbi:MAG: hypothetical protein ACFCVD_01215 [Nodosilinea sp.]
MPNQFVRASVDSASQPAQGPSTQPSMSADGRFVAFASLANDLDPMGGNGFSQVYVRDTQTGATRVISLGALGALADGDSFAPSISGDGRYIAFVSQARNLSVSDIDIADDVYVYDIQTGSLRLISVSTGGTKGNSSSVEALIANDGQSVVFTSFATNLVAAADTNQAGDVFLHNLATGETRRISQTAGGEQANDLADDPTLSADGRFMTFTSIATNLVPGDTNGVEDVFIQDRASGVLEIISQSTAGALGNGISSVDPAALSADGRYVVFSSLASNLVAGDTNTAYDIFRRDRVLGTTTRLSVAADGTQANGASNKPRISGDGRYVIFESLASNLVAGDTNGVADVFLHDTATGTTSLVSTDLKGTVGNGASFHGVISLDGKVLAFASAASNLVANDANGVEDVLVGGPCTAHTDFNQDCFADIVWRNPANGESYVWFLENGIAPRSNRVLLNVPDPHWHIEGVGDFDGDGVEDDLAWVHRQTLEVSLWFTDQTVAGTVAVGGGFIESPPSSTWQFGGVGDFDGDGGQDDLIWYDTAANSLEVWFIQNGKVTSRAAIATQPGGEGWAVVGVGNFDLTNHLQDDILWHNTITGENAAWIFNGTEAVRSEFFLPVPELAWTVQGVTDLDGDGRADDLLWQHTGSGRVNFWYLNGTDVIDGVIGLQPPIDPSFQVVV